MTNKVYNPLIKMAAFTIALASASCCCCNNNHKRSAPPRVVPNKSATVQTPCSQPRPRTKKVIPPYRTNEVLNFNIQTQHPLPGNYVTPYNEDGTSFPIQNKNLLPGNLNFWYGGYYYY